MDAGPSGAEKVRWERREGVAVLTVANPPVNALVQPVRAALLESLERAEADPDVSAILIQAEGRTFPAGADVREFSVAAGEPTLADLCRRIEDCTKPVVAAIHGTALGGGLELALACHYRMALHDARFGFPEVSLGLVPNAGGTQRLPRLVGARVALDLLTTGKPIDANRALAAGLVDKIVQKNLDKAAFGSARNFAESGVPPRPTRDRTEGFGQARPYLEAVAARRAAMQGGAGEAGIRAVELVEAALLVPFDAGLEMEHAAYNDLVNSDAARGLRHAFLAERRAGRFPSLAGVAAQRVSSVGVVGAGQMGNGIAHVMALAGYDVLLTDISQDALDAALDTVRKNLERQVSRDKISQSDADAAMARIKTTLTLTDLGPSDLIIEAATERETVKQAIFEDLLPHLGPETILTSNTSSISITRLASRTDRPEKFMGFHFMNPVPVMQLVELIRGIATDQATFEACQEVVENLGKTAASAEDFPAFIVNRILMPMINEAVYTLYEGVGSVKSIDQSMKLGANHPMGPLELADFIGLDTCLAIMNVLHDGLADTKYRPCPLLTKYVEAGWLGRKTGRGFYDYRGDVPVPTR